MAKQVNIDTDEEKVAETTESGVIVDLSAIKEPEPIADGTYDAVVRKAELVRPTEAGKHPYFKMQFQIKGDEDGDFYNRYIFSNMSFHPKAMTMTRDALVAMGVDPKATGEITTDELVGAEIRLVVKMQTKVSFKQGTNEAYPLRPEVKKILARSDALEGVFR